MRHSLRRRRIAPTCSSYLRPRATLSETPGTRRGLLLGGVLKQLDNKTWTYRTKGPGMSMVQFPTKMSIQWDLDDHRMLNWNELAALIGPEVSYSVMLRLREPNALELQQQLLAGSG
jgi:hypothetical protein